MTTTRRYFRSLRQALNPQTQRKNALSLARAIISHPFFIKAHHIGFYWSMDGEIETRPLMDHAFSLNKECYLPSIATGADRLSGNHLRFQRYDPDQKSLSLNAYGIPEPKFSYKARIRTCMLDLVFVPMVAFDPFGNRLGMGKGYYDQTFSPNKLRWRRPVIAGIAHSVQKTKSLTTNCWDVPMDIIVTEKELLFFDRTKN